MKHTRVPKEKIFSADAVVIALFKKDELTKHPFFAALKKEDQLYLASALSTCKRAYLDTEKYILPSKTHPTLFVFGLGEKTSWSLRKLQTAARKLMQCVKASSVSSMTVCIDDFSLSTHSLEKAAEVFSMNVELSHYMFSMYREAPKEGWPSIKEVHYYSIDTKRTKHLHRAIHEGVIIGEQVNNARDLSNIPGGDMTPKVLAREALKKGKACGVEVTILGEKAMKKLRMGGILGVSRGSKEEAQFIIMKYLNASTSKKPYVFVGKGITFDTGGLHLKPSNAMDEMHMDMSGGAAVINAVLAIARMKLKVNVIGLIPAAENMPSGESYRPGDVLRSMSGKTIEVVSPDAEGRVVLADALTYAERYEPALVIDVATLTGACSVALGRHASAILSPQEKLIPHLKRAGEESGDHVWELPMWEEYEADVKGQVGDILNAGKNREAGTINAAMFLWQFTKKFSHWAHCDIASTMTTSPDQFLSKGSSGSGTRFLIEVARSLWGKTI